MTPEDEVRLRFLNAITNARLALLDADAAQRELLTCIRDLLEIDTAAVLLYERSASISCPAPWSAPSSTSSGRPGFR